MACYEVDAVNPSRIWQTANILSTELPVLATQVVFVVTVYRFLFFVYKPFHQPPLISQISVGFVLSQIIRRISPSAFSYVYPVDGVLNIEVLTHIGVVYYSFLSGLEINLDTILYAKKKAATIAISGIIFPMVMGPALYTLHRKVYGNGDGSELEENKLNAYVLWTLVLTVTGFPVVVHSLSELKLLYTGLGKAALTAAMIGDTYAWILFTLFVPFTVNGTGAIYSVLSTIIFAFICIYVVRPIIVKVIDRNTERDQWDDNQLLFVVMGIFLCAHITDALGTHGVVGAFVYGLILPHGKFADMVMSMTDDFGGTFLAPLFFSGTGMRLMVATIFEHPNWPFTLMVIILLCLLKILSTLFATFFFGMHARDGFALGLILNTKGAIALIMLNMAWDKSILLAPSYAVLASAVILMTIVVPPIINAIYKPRKRFEQNKLKTIQKLRLDAELRIQACVHNTRHATGIIKLIETFNATRLSPIHVFSLYLVELTGRAGALVAAHMEKPNGQFGVQNLTRSQEELESIDNIFKAFGEAYDAIRVQTLNVVSAYETIHEDIYNSAKEKGTSLIILPFHKQISSEGALETTNIAYQDINQNVMKSAPCSVGIFVDRDIGQFDLERKFHICMIFVGGPDDREALAIAWRMAGHPGVRLSVVRMLLFDEAAEVDTSSHNEAQGILLVVMDSEMQNDLDDEYVNSFRLTAVNNNDSITYSEVDVHSGEDIPTTLKELENFGCDLYIVGQGNRRSSQAFSSLSEWCDCSELGVIGDMLASDNFGSRSSVLVVQQYGYGGMVLPNQHNHMKTNNDGSESLIVKTE
ncbi:cation/H(+) antiporter 15-like [Trifolium pratense]|uniref:cation/H(+) antiporter 15-like n=1 Tax=Trifolium pratense TaxID=57577 RepID=UPI001E69347F|nr:cation/H(+) antiporter 15-like [Trifolium pratense]